MICKGHEYNFNFDCSYIDFNDNWIVIRSEEEVIHNENEIVLSKKINEPDNFFYAWQDVSCEISEIGSDEYVNLTVEALEDDNYCLYYFSYHHNFFVKREDAKRIIKLYRKRNLQIKKEKIKIVSYIDNYILDIANNLVNVVDMSVFNNRKVLLYCSRKYSALRDNTGHQVFNLEQKRNGDFTKEAEKYNKQLRSEISKIEPFLKNMTEIVCEVKNVKDYIARAIVWEAVQRKMLDYYSDKWQEEYELKLETEYDQMLKQMSNRNIDEIHEEYVKSVYLCDEIDITNIWETLIYFLISKEDISGKSIYNLFVEYERKLMKIKETLSNDAIKKKLITKQKRKIIKYTITDVDLMTGSEFEEFVGVLFKKMGYASRVTQKSGDQGIDVIATRNGTKIGIQAKCYSNSVGNSAVQEAIAGKNFYKCDKALVVTNNYFTPAAIELAQTSDIILWNRDLLKEKIAEFMGE